MLGRRECAKRVVRKLHACTGLVGVAQGLRDRVPGSIADLEQPVARRPAAACEPIAAVRTCELDSELLEPVDRRRRLAREHLDESRVRGLVRAPHDVLGMDLGRVVLAECCLDPALSLRGVARLERRLRREGDARSRTFGRDGCGEAGGTAADHEHVEGGALAHEADPSADPYLCHYQSLSDDC